MSNLTREEEQQDRENIRKHGKLIREGYCIDKRETREEAITRTENEVKLNLRKLREMK